MKAIYIYIVSGLLLLTTACKEDVDPGVSPVYPVAGEWVVYEYYEGDSHGYGPYHIEIYNTAFEKNDAWIENVYGAGVKVKVNVNEDKTFDATDAEDVSGGYLKATISNGKVIDTDSVYFEVTLYNLEGETEAEFFTAGRRWTGLEGQ